MKINWSADGMPVHFSVQIRSRLSAADNSAEFSEKARDVRRVDRGKARVMSADPDGQDSSLDVPASSGLVSSLLSTGAIVVPSAS
jgi:hypothetical protein